MNPPFRAGAVVFAKDPERVGRFYEALAGLAVAQREPGFILLESAAFQLAVVAMAADLAEQITLAAPPVRREQAAIKLCFAVPCLAAARETAGRLGGGLNAPEREWAFQGHWVCDGHDPEGNCHPASCRPALSGRLRGTGRGVPATPCRQAGASCAIMRG